MINVAIGIDENRFLSSAFGVNTHRVVSKVDRDSILHFAIDAALTTLLLANTRNNLPPELSQVCIQLGFRFGLREVRFISRF